MLRKAGIRMVLGVGLAIEWGKKISGLLERLRIRLRE